MAISTFLPLVEPIGAFHRVQGNTLIQHGGWMLVAVALGIAASGYRASQGRWTARWALGHPWGAASQVYIQWSSDPSATIDGSARQQCRDDAAMYRRAIRSIGSPYPRTSGTGA